MANTLPSAIGDAYRAAEIVGAEGVGLLNSVLINTGSEAVAQGQSVRSLKTAEPTLNTSATPAMTIPEGDDQTSTEDTMTLSQVANVKINLTGEEEREIDTNYSSESFQTRRFLRAFRKIRNAIEAHCCTVAYQSASRAFGTAGTTPFGSNFNEIAELRQILFDNGFLEIGETSLVINSLAGTNLRQLAQLQKANESASSDLLRRGELLDLQGFSIKESAGIQAHTKGTGTSYAASAAIAVGATTVPVDTGSNTIIAGDVVTFATDSINKYMVNTALSGGSFTIGDPGIRTAIVDTTAVTVGNSFTANLAVSRPCMELAARPQAAPKSGDAASDVMSVSDPYTGLVYEIREYAGYKKLMWDVTVIYQAKVWNPDGVAVLLG